MESPYQASRSHKIGWLPNHHLLREAFPAFLLAHSQALPPPPALTKLFPLCLYSVGPPSMCKCVYQWLAYGLTHPLKRKLYEGRDFGFYCYVLSVQK